MTSTAPSTPSLHNIPRSTAPPQSGQQLTLRSAGYEGVRRAGRMAANNSKICSRPITPPTPSAPARPHSTCWSRHCGTRGGGGQPARPAPRATRIQQSPPHRQNRKIEKIILAKAKGVKVTVEVTPHHLFFDEKIISEQSRVKFQVNPPIRQTRENRLALIKYLKDGAIDYLATDHAPHALPEKMKGISGLTHLDTYGPFISWLIKEHNFTPDDIKRVCSENPGNFINKFHNDRYGKIETGYVGSLTVIDLEKEIKITKEMLKTKSGWSPFEGITFPGRVAMTIIKGKIHKN